MSVPWPTHKAKARSRKAYRLYLARQRRIARRTPRKHAPSTTTT